MRPLGKAIRTAHAQKQKRKQELFKFLRNYTATPHSTTKTAPATLLSNRPMRTKLPELKLGQENDSKISNRDERAKIKIKQNADRRGNAKHNNLKIGGPVLVKAKQGK